MLKVAIFLGLYSYEIFILGLVNLLYPLPVLIVSTLSFVVFLLLIKKDISKIKLSKVHFSKIEKLYLVLISIILITNFIGALGPELGFDALWYHLTMPKIFIEHGRIFYIKNELFYYSLLPKLTEMLYIPSIMLGGEIMAKITHFVFGLLTLISTYKIAKLYLKRKWALLSVIILLSNLVICWMMITAYIDLARGFYETLSLYYILSYSKTGKTRELIFSAILIGFAISAKLVSIGTIFILLAVIVFSNRVGVNKLKKSITFLIISLSVSSPWLLVSYYYVKNPIYPIFSNYSPQVFRWENLYPIKIVENILSVFLYSSDPINPIYIIALPLLVFSLRKLFQYKEVFIYSIFSIFIWYASSFLGLWHATESAGSSRFLISFLPAYSVLLVLVVTKYYSNYFKKVIVVVSISILIVVISYRMAANFQYIPYILNQESKEAFLMRNLHFDFGDFYDENQKIKSIVGNKLVLVRGIHNLYYVDFPFTLDNWENAKDSKFLLTGDNFENNSDKVIYENQTTHVKLYKL